MGRKSGVIRSEPISKGKNDFPGGGAARSFNFGLGMASISMLSLVIAISLFDAINTGHLNSSARLKACIVREKQSLISTGASTITGKPPLLPQRINCISPSAPRVAEPVEGPSLCITTITIGISLPMAKEICSLYRLRPGPDVAVMTLSPAMDAPRHEPIEAISSSP